MKPTQAQTPAKKKMMMYFTKYGLSLAMVTTTSVFIHILDNHLAIYAISGIQGLWDDSCR